MLGRVGVMVIVRVILGLRLGLVYGYGMVRVSI